MSHDGRNEILFWKKMKSTRDEGKEEYHFFIFFLFLNKLNHIENNEK